MELRECMKWPQSQPGVFQEMNDPYVVGSPCKGCHYVTVLPAKAVTHWRHPPLPQDNSRAPGSPTSLRVPPSGGCEDLDMEMEEEDELRARGEVTVQ